MEQRRTVGQYRMIDLSLFLVMLAVAETVIVKAATAWFPGQPYTLSVVGAITAIVMMRWGIYGGIHAAAGGAVFCLASGATPEQFLIYCGGNLLGLGVLVMRKVLGPERIREDTLRSMLFGLLTILLMQLGRGLVALITGASLQGALAFITTDVLSILFTVLIVWITRRLDGVFEDQINYLLRLAREREREKENSNEG